MYQLNIRGIFISKQNRNNSPLREHMYNAIKGNPAWCVSIAWILSWYPFGAFGVLKHYYPQWVSGSLRSRITCVQPVLTWPWRGTRRLRRLAGFSYRVVSTTRFKIQTKESNSPFSSGLCNHLSETPQASTVEQFASGRISFRSPLRRQLHHGRLARLFALRNEDDPLLHEPLVGILECLFVDSLKVRKVTLMV